MYLRRGRGNSETTERENHKFKLGRSLALI